LDDAATITRRKIYTNLKGYSNNSNVLSATINEEGFNLTANLDPERKNFI
jgi:hypothetical protein